MLAPKFPDHGTLTPEELHFQRLDAMAALVDAEHWFVLASTGSARKLRFYASPVVLAEMLAGALRHCPSYAQAFKAALVDAGHCEILVPAAAPGPSLPQLN